MELVYCDYKKALFKFYNNSEAEIEYGIEVYRINSNLTLYLVVDFSKILTAEEYVSDIFSFLISEIYDSIIWNKYVKILDQKYTYLTVIFKDINFSQGFDDSEFKAKNYSSFLREYLQKNYNNACFINFNDIIKLYKLEKKKREKKFYKLFLLPIFKFVFPSLKAGKETFENILSCTFTSD